MTKNTIAFLTALMMAAALTACRGGTSSSAGIQASQPAAFQQQAVPSSSESQPAQTETLSADESQPEEPVDSSAAESQYEAQAEQPTAPKESPVSTVESGDTPDPQGGVLIAYFSRVGNTDFSDDVEVIASASLNLQNGALAGNAQLLAAMIQSEAGGDLFLIETEEPYPEEYRATTDAARTEQSQNARPALSSHVENFDQYDTIFLVYPNWWGTLPQPVFTFLEEYDFSGKTIAPLCTHEGSGMGSSERDIAALCPDAQLLDGLAVRGGSAADGLGAVQGWIAGLGL